MVCQNPDAEPDNEPRPPARRPSERVPAARDRGDRRVGDLVGLLARRPDLRGVHAPADAFDEAIRWEA